MATNATVRSVNDVIELWVKNVIEFSSQYNNTSWSANSVIGEPRVYPQYGDIHGAWAQADVSENEFIMVEYDEALYITGINIYETLNAGAVVKISSQNPHGEWVVLWQANSPQVIQTSRIFSPTLTEETFSSQRVKLELNCTMAASWCEIDAIKITGKRWQYKPPPMSDLSDSLRQLVNSELFSDVTFDVDGQPVYAHKAILAVRSQYFRAMFCSGLKESQAASPDEISLDETAISWKSQVIAIHDVTHPGLIAMMQYIYTNTFNTDVTPSHMAELIRVADRFSLDGMKKLCNVTLCSQVNLDNVIEIYTNAVQILPRLDEVVQTCLGFIAVNLDKVTKTAAFCSLPYNLLLEVVQEATARLSIRNQ